MSRRYTFLLKGEMGKRRWVDYPKQLKAEMGNGYSGFMMTFYPKQP
jgi:hypothetical protein